MAFVDGGFSFKVMEQNHLIIRHNSGGNFTILNNDILQDTNMTFFSKGLLCYLLSLPKDWQVSVAQVADKFGEKESRILRAFRELIDLGYCMRKACHENGRLKGQRYYISDVAGVFGEIERKPKEPSLFDENTAPPKKGGTECSAPPKNSPTEKTAPTKNGGAYTKDDNQETKEYYNKNKKTLFSENSVLANIDFVLEKFAGVEYEEVDLVYYYHAVRDWSDSSNTKRTENGWIATIRSFIRTDIERNKLHKKAQYRADAVIADEALQFLKM